MSEPEESLSLQTKVNDYSVPNVNKHHLLHAAQSNHITIIINNIVYKNGRYALGLSEKQMTMLGISEDEQAFGKELIDTLNKHLK